MHIAFDGGCFQQGLLAGIHQVACGFLNAAKASHPDLQVTLVCDSRQGLAGQAALDGLTWQPQVVYAPVARSYDEPAPWPGADDPGLRFFVDGRIVRPELDGGTARYAGPAPATAFAIVSRSARPASGDAAGPGPARRLGVRVDHVLLGRGARTLRVAGTDRRLSTGFLDGGAARWTDGAGFIPLSLFPPGDGPVTAEVAYAAQDRYAMDPGPAAQAVLRAQQARRDAERGAALEALSARLRGAGCQAYVANHFTPIHLPGMANAAWAYDLIPVLLPQYFHSDAQANFRENLRVFRQAGRVYAISDTTRNDLLANTPVRADQVITAGIAPSRAFHPRDDAAVRLALHPHGLRPGGYILAVATIEPRKNHLRLLHAYLDLRARLQDCPPLVIVGKPGWDCGQVFAFRTENGLEPSVKMLSGVDGDDLACLYSGALFSAYLSVYEGFGLPVVEAMACGCPVLTSDRSSMAEVAGKAASLVNPYDIPAIAGAMHAMATDGKLRAALSQAGRARARAYTWERSSRIVMDDLAQLAA